MTEPPPPPNETYYRACAGRWTCAFSGDVDDFKALRDTIGFMNALGLFLISKWPAILGRPRMTTSVAVESPELAVHTTKVTWLGLPLIWSREDLALDADGESLMMTSWVRAMPLPFLVERAGGPGSIAADTSSATYHIAIYGGEMVQTTRRSADQVILEQVLPGYRAKHPLRRSTG